MQTGHSYIPQGRIRSYRFGFNGMEKINEQYGEVNAYDFGARIYDPRIGRWLSLDPQAKTYPFVSPYQFVNNSPMRFIDPDGKKWVNPYVEAINREMALDNPDMDKIALLTKYAVEVINIISEIEKNDPELYNYIQNAQFRNDDVNVIVYLSSESPSVSGAYAETAYGVAYTQTEGSNAKRWQIRSGKLNNANILGKDELGSEGAPKENEWITFNIVLYQSSAPKDETLANEAGDVMNGIVNPEAVFNETVSGPTDYNRKESTYYSYNVEEVYVQRKRGKESKESNVYPLIRIPGDKSSQTQDKRTVKRNEGIK